MVASRDFLISREMASLANNLWFARNQPHYGTKAHSAPAAVPQDYEELEEAVALLNMQPKGPNPRKRWASLASRLVSSAAATRRLGTRPGSVLTLAAACGQETSRPRD